MATIRNILIEKKSKSERRRFPFNHRNAFDVICQTKLLTKQMLRMQSVAAKRFVLRLSAHDAISSVPFTMRRAFTKAAVPNVLPRKVPTGPIITHWPIAACTVLHWQSIAHMNKRHRISPHKKIYSQGIFLTEDAQNTRTQFQVN